MNTNASKLAENSWAALAPVVQEVPRDLWMSFLEDAPKHTLIALRQPGSRLYYLKTDDSSWIDQQEFEQPYDQYSQVVLLEVYHQELYELADRIAGRSELSIEVLQLGAN